MCVLEPTILVFHSCVTSGLFLIDIVFVFYLKNLDEHEFFKLCSRIYIYIFRF